MSVEDGADGTVRVEDEGEGAGTGREWQFANPSVRVRRVFLWPSSVLDGIGGLAWLKVRAFTAARPFWLAGAAE